MMQEFLKQALAESLSRDLSVILRVDTFRNIYGKPKILEGRIYIKKSFRHSYCFSYAQMYCFSFVFYTFCIFFVEEEIHKKLSRNHLYCMKKSSSHLKQRRILNPVKHLRLRLKAVIYFMSGRARVLEIATLKNSTKLLGKHF